MKYLRYRELKNRRRHANRERARRVSRMAWASFVLDAKRGVGPLWAKKVYSYTIVCACDRAGFPAWNTNWRAILWEWQRLGLVIRYNDGSYLINDPERPGGLLEGFEAEASTMDRYGETRRAMRVDVVA